MAGLNGEDRAGGGEVSLLVNVGGGSEVSGRSNTLEDLGGGQERLDGGEGSVKVVLADANDGSSDALEGSDEEVDVGLLL